MCQWEGLSHILWNTVYHGHHDMMEGWNTCRCFFLISNHMIYGDLSGDIMKTIGEYLAISSRSTSIISLNKSPFCAEQSPRRVRGQNL